MQVRVNVLVMVALAVFASATAIARADEGEDAPGEHDWVPSFAISIGVVFGDQKGTHSSFDRDDDVANAPFTTLRRPVTGDDRAVSPYVGGALELMTPTLLPHVRLFGVVEFVPFFAPERDITQEGKADRIRGPNVGAVLVGDEDAFHFTTGAQGTQTGPRPPGLGFGEDDSIGQGMRGTMQVDQLAFGAKAGIAYSFGWRGHEIRIKPSLGWFHYRLALKGHLVHAECLPFNLETLCSNTYTSPGQDPPFQHGDFREVIISGRDKGQFDAFGPGIDVEMQTGRLGPIGTALFVGIHAYYQPGDRDIALSKTATYNDAIGNTTYVANWSARVAPWIYRGGLGIRFQWLGDSD
jgi:hypothetical protein